MYGVERPSPSDVLAVRTAAEASSFFLRPLSTSARSLGSVVTVYANGGRYCRNGALAETEAWLDPRRFLRLDQSRVINITNITRIREFVPWNHQCYRPLFTDSPKAELIVSRDVGRRLRAKFSRQHADRPGQVRSPSRVSCASPRDESCR